MSLRETKKSRMKVKVYDKVARFGRLFDVKEDEFLFRRS